MSTESTDSNLQQAIFEHLTTLDPYEQMMLQHHLWTEAFKAGELEEYGSTEKLPLEVRVAYEQFIRTEMLIIALNMPFEDGSRLEKDEIRRRLNYVARKFAEYDDTPVLTAALDKAKKSSESGKKNKRGDDREMIFHQQRNAHPNLDRTRLLERVQRELRDRGTVVSLKALRNTLPAKDFP